MGHYLSEMPEEYQNMIASVGGGGQRDMVSEGRELALHDEIFRLRSALNKPLRETILAVLTTMPKEAVPEHLAAMIENQVRSWQAIP